MSTLAAFYATIGPLLEGRAPLRETQAALWPTGAPQPDAERLGIYQRFCRAHRVSALAAFPETRRAAAAAGVDWAALAEAYFHAHPMHHVELNENASAFPAFLAEEASFELPPFVTALADLELWVWRTRVAPDSPDDTAPGPLRLASTVELRPYAWDLVGWLDAGSRAECPGRSPGFVLFWRDADGDPRREPATPAELHVLKCVLEGLPVPEHLTDTLADLRAAQIVLGG